MSFEAFVVEAVQQFRELRLHFVTDECIRIIALFNHRSSQDMLKIIPNFNEYIGECMVSAIDINDCIKVSKL